MSDRVLLRHGDCHAIFDLADGFRLTSLRLGGCELIAQDRGLGTLWWGSFVMAPWTSDLLGGRFEFLGDEYSLPVDQNDAAIHGVARKERWAWDGHRASCALGSGWPFGGTVLAEPQLGDDVLRMTMTLVGGGRAMPGAIGWHPWFARRIGGVGGEAILPAGALQQHRDERGVPTGLWQAELVRPFNDGFRLDGPVEVVWPGVGRVRVVSDGGYMIVFDHSEQGICVEPMTSPAGRMDRILRPGEALALRFSVEWEGR